MGIIYVVILDSWFDGSDGDLEGVVSSEDGISLSAGDNLLGVRSDNNGVGNLSNEAVDMDTQVTITLFHRIFGYYTLTRSPSLSLVGSDLKGE